MMKVRPLKEVKLDDVIDQNINDVDVEDDIEIIVD